VLNEAVLIELFGDSTVDRHGIRPWRVEVSTQQQAICASGRQLEQ
jgi:hypothetical protein